MAAPVVERDLVSLAVLEVFSRPPIYDLVFSPLSPGDLVRTSRTCTQARDAVHLFCNRAFNVNRHLSRFFNDPLGFRSLQASTSTLIAGSNALQFLERTFYPDSDLDLYVHPGFSGEVGRWLIDKEGYVYKPFGDQNANFNQEDEEVMNHMREVNLAPGLTPSRGDLLPFENRLYKLKGIEAIFCFERPSQDAREEPLKIQIMVATRTPLQCILGFHSTVVMNIITYNSAHALYPTATFEKRRSLVMGRRFESPSDSQALAKYMRRGWKFMAAPGRHPVPDYFRVGITRTVNDLYSWTINLSQDGVQPPRPHSLTSDPLSWDPIKYNSFRLTPRPIDGNMYMWYELFSSTMLRFKYLVTDDIFLNIMTTFFRRQGYMVRWPGSNNTGPRSLVGTEHWTWWDAEIPVLYEEFLQERERLQRSRNTVSLSVLRSVGYGGDA